jgi:hypothetical protein
MLRRHHGVQPPNKSVAPDRAAMLAFCDTTPLQAARQVNAVVGPPNEEAS